MSCPICQSDKSTSLLSLDNFPIYQHPMSDTTTIPLPHNIDLAFVICDNCGHGYQNQFDRNILENIYEQYYYTPAPHSIGTALRNEFIDFFDLCIEVGINKSILEIGCSSGDVLLTLRERLPLCRFKAVEPNKETADVARMNFFDVTSHFFTQTYAKSLNYKIDIIYSRHVIEHIFDFNDFFSAITSISHENTRLVLETPSLDWSTEHGSVMPFHVEHVHIFSKRSLILLAQQFGWYENISTVTLSGNLIINFIRKNNNLVLPSAPQNLSRIKIKNIELMNDIQNICKNKKVIFWGAGGGAITLLSLSKIIPTYIVDGNVNKTGKVFCGQDTPIGYAPIVIKELIQKDEDKKMVMIISSSFFTEITKELATLGWRGTVYVPYQN